MNIYSGSGETVDHTLMYAIESPIDIGTGDGSEGTADQQFLQADSEGAGKDGAASVDGKQPQAPNGGNGGGAEGGGPGGGTGAGRGGGRRRGRGHGRGRGGDRW
ncbi:hypothetical protein CBL_20450 [Carabus blaptoides fortunei]